MAYLKIIFVFLLIIKLSSEKCSDKKVKWCINSEYFADGKIVHKESCKKRPCIISICPYGHMIYKRKCIKMDSVTANFSEIHTIYRLMSGKPVKTDKKFGENFQVVTYRNNTLIRQSNCTNPFLNIGEEIPDGHFLVDGSFFLQPKTILTPEEFIVMFTIINQKPVLKIKFAKDDVYENPADQLIELVFDYALFVSVFFMILVLVVYTLCKELRTTAGLIFMTYVATLAMTFLLIPIRSLTLKYRMMDDTGCYAISPVIHFFTLSSFMWMNVMGFDIWWTLRNMFHQGCLGMRNAVNYRKYIWYCIIVWVPTLVYVIIEICLDEFTQFDGPEFIKCTSCGNSLYLEGPMLTLVMINLIPLVLIIFNLMRIQKSYLTHLNNSDSNNTSPKQNALLCLKISFMLGTNWILDMMLSFFYEDLPNWFKYTVKAVNAQNGLILFIIYILKPDVLLKLFRRLSINNGITKHLEKRVSRKYSNNSRKLSQPIESSSGSAISSNHSLTLLQRP